MTYRSAGEDGLDRGSGRNQTLTKCRPAPFVDAAASSSGGKSREVLANALLSGQTEITRRIREAVQGEIPFYRVISGQTLDVEIAVELGPLLHCAGSERALTDRESADLAALAEQRVRQGAPVDEVLRAYRIGIQTVVACAREVGQHRGIAEAQVLEFVQSLLASSDLAMVTATRAHLRAERALPHGSDESRTDFVRGVLLGTVSDAELRIRAEMYGLDPIADYVAVRARLRENGARCQFERALGLRDPARDRSGMVAIVDGDAAGFLSAPPPKCVDTLVGFGPPRPLERLVESYRAAARALVTAEACGFEGAHDIASLGLRAAIASDGEVGELVRRRYLEPLAGASSEAELIATLRTYLACGMHVERTATRLFVHQNTVRYRIARFEELTGKDLSDIEVLFEVWWALEASAMRL
jgi:PucR C-terminal helix-turn-helix domain